MTNFRVFSFGGPYWKLVHSCRLLSLATNVVLFNKHIMCMYVFPKLSRREKEVVSIVCKRWKKMWSWKRWIPTRKSSCMGEPFESWVCWDIIDNDATYLNWMLEDSDNEDEGCKTNPPLLQVQYEMDVFGVSFWVVYVVIVGGVLVLIRALFFFFSP